MSFQWFSYIKRAKFGTLSSFRGSVLSRLAEEARTGATLSQTWTSLKISRSDQT